MKNTAGSGISLRTMSCQNQSRGVFGNSKLLQPEEAGNLCGLETPNTAKTALQLDPGRIFFGCDRGGEMT